jgi:lysophospholipase L1-like esterase
MSAIRNTYRFCSTVWLISTLQSGAAIAAHDRDSAREKHHAAEEKTVFEHVNFSGRFDFAQPSAPACTWTYCGLEFDFRGKGLNLSLSGAGQIQFYITVDGKFLPSITTEGAVWSTTDTPVQYTIASELTDGLHHIEIHRGPEGMFGAVRFHDIKIHHGHVIRTKHRHHRTIEVIGDSISAGYGNLAGVVPCEFGTAFENGYMTYGAIAARLLNAEVRIEAFSGIGVARSLDGSTTWTMPNVWDNVNVFDASVKYDCSNWDADAVVINLGTNDFNAGVDPSLYVEAYVDYLQAIRECYPHALILCATNDTNDKYYATLDTVIEVVADRRIKKINLGTPNWAGCDGHPDIIAHIAMGENLAARLRTELHW